MREHTRAPSGQALDCFIHGVSHLIDEFGFAEGVKKGANLLSLISQVEPALGFLPDGTEYRYRDENDRETG